MRAGPFGASAISLISSATKGILDRFIEGQNLDRLPEVFNTLGLSSEVQLIYRLDFKPNFHLNEDLPKKSKIEFAYSHQTLHGLKDLGIRTSAAFIDSHLKLDDREKSKLNWAIDNLRKTISNEATISISLDFTHRGAFTLNNAMSHNIDLLESINILVNYNLIHLMDMKLHKHNYGSMSLRRASSGEQCMLVIMLGIAGNISDNSLIFIDEPEISLHPKWQEDFMPLLIKTFSKYRACQFFIATHSPQMISNLRDNNCFVTSLTKNHVFPSSYFFNMSSDFQLAELFDAPGPKNEYISRLVFSLLSKIKRNKTIDQEDRTQLSKLLLISKNLAEVDPTFELIKTAEEVVKHYATHRK
jgi:predicted ATP-binding protein involved in virulence